MIREISGLVVINDDAVWGYSGGEEYGYGSIENGVDGIQSVVDRLTSRATRMDHPEYVLDDNTHCLLLTTSESDEYSLKRLVETIEKTMPEHTRCDWLHIEFSDGMTYSEAEKIIASWNGGEFDRNCVRNRTASEKIEYHHREWSAAVIQYLESRMLEREGAISFDENERTPRTFGFATIDFSQTEGRRFLESKAFLQMVGRENERIDLDLVFRRCSEALRGGEKILVNALLAADSPADIEGLVHPNESYEKFDARKRLEAFREDVTNQSGAIERTEQAIEEGIRDLKVQLDGVLETCNRSAQERLSIIESLLGQVPQRTYGKPLRTTMMLDDCEKDCLAEIASFSNRQEEVPSMHELHIQRRFCAELGDNIVSLTRAIEMDEEAGIDSELERQELKRQKAEFEKCRSGYEELRIRYTRFRRSIFSSLSSQWMAELFERLVMEATYVYEKPIEEKKPLLSPIEKLILIASSLILPVWLWLSWKIGLKFWFEQTLFSAIYALVWAAVISYRLRPKRRVVENPMVIQRKKWIDAARQYHRAMVSFAALTRFEKLFDEQIRKPLLLEFNKLSEMLGHLRNSSDHDKSILASSFTEVDFIQHIGNTESFNRFFEEKLAIPMSSAPSIVHVYMDYMAKRKRRWTVEEAVTEYRHIIKAEIDEHLEALERFEMLDYVLEREHKNPPLFVDPDLPPLEELIRRAKISLGALHDCPLEEDGQLTVFIGRRDNTILIDRFREHIGRLFAESRQSRLDFVVTDDINRIGFIRMVDINMDALKVREKQDSHRTRKRKPTPPPIARNEENDVPVTSGGNEFGKINNSELKFQVRGIEVVAKLPTVTEAQWIQIESLERFERGVRLLPGQDAEQVVFEHILQYSEYDDVLKGLVAQMEEYVPKVGASTAELLIALVQSIPYQIGTHEKYPIETLICGHGDCSDKSVLLKKLLGIAGINSVLLLYEDLSHMALGVKVPESAPGYKLDGCAFLECTAPFVVGNEPAELASGKNPKDSIPELLLPAVDLNPWAEYAAYRTEVSGGSREKKSPTIRNIKDDLPPAHSESAGA